MHCGGSFVDVLYWNALGMVKRKNFASSAILGKLLQDLETELKRKENAFDFNVTFT